MSREWDSLAEWWLLELESDPTYEQVVVPLLLDLVAADRGTVLDVGCGNGRIMAMLKDGDLHPIGCDVNSTLLKDASRVAPVMQVELPGVPLRDGSLDGGVVVLSFEHFSDEIFVELARVIRSGGWLAAVANHPFVTAPGSASVIDPTDGEVFWRPGTYLERGSTLEDADGQPVTFIHRPLGQLLNVAADAGFALTTLREEPLDAGGLPDAGLPRLIGVRWTRR